ncbi:hypothetical protein BDY21DRAFT_15514 [Lineolata rhizophorae]|uniref:Uncharacterized protein n=1 Tax=Lineolata rhizophorae TaxID=578093 RepID=A0A6A6P1E6_9PEZI|nr:hypothetical protein BDY21DRAFT_15514 [Lineolata rhizophorae]
MSRPGLPSFPPLQPPPRPASNHGVSTPEGREEEAAASNRPDRHRPPPPEGGTSLPGRLRRRATSSSSSSSSPPRAGTSGTAGASGFCHRHVQVSTSPKASTFSTSRRSRPAHWSSPPPLRTPPPGILQPCPHPAATCPPHQSPVAAREGHPRIAPRSRPGSSVASALRFQVRRRVAGLVAARWAINLAKRSGGAGETQALGRAGTFPREPPPDGTALPPAASHSPLPCVPRRPSSARGPGTRNCVPATRPE